jgi:hypothetical protein
MKTSIPVADRKEADAIRRGLEDPAIRAFVIVMGVLLALPTDRARKRVLQFVSDRLEEEQELERPELGQS